MYLQAIVLGVLAISVSAHRAHKLVELEPEVSAHNASVSSWEKVSRTSESKLIKFHVGLKVNDDNLAKLEDIFWKVSDPMNEMYGEHLTIEQVRDVLAVPKRRIRKIRHWLKRHGAKDVKLNAHRDTFVVHMHAKKLEKMVHTTLHDFRHKEYPEVVITRASEKYFVPARVASKINFVGELLQFPALRRKDLLKKELQGSGKWKNECDSASCSGLVQPSVLNERYKIPNSTLPSDTAGGNKMAVAEFQGQYYEDKDISSFGSSCHVPAKVDKVIGGNSQSAGIEAELDIEYINAVAPGIPLTVVYSQEYSLLNWVNQITGDKTMPKVHSVSYGNDEKQQSSRSYILQSNTAFMKAGAQGISILFASGDQGVCGREGCGFFRKKFHPDFPAGSPYITSVGGTNFAGDSIGDESAWDSSGGGFSDNFPIPDFQKEAVAAYKANPSANLPKQSYWNNTGRGYPDVAALGGTKTPYCIATGGRFAGVAGTSAACPVVAGLFARLNGLRLSKGGKVMGFLNPWIYQNGAKVFQDVTSGCNDEGGSAGGFTATKGWDPATGWGTPDFEAMSKAI